MRGLEDLHDCKHIVNPMGVGGGEPHARASTLKTPGHTMVAVLKAVVGKKIDSKSNFV